jgi:hypothetical protein
VSAKTEKEVVQIAKRNALSWAHYARTVYVPYLDTFSEVVLQWLAPAMSDENISKAAGRVESEAYQAYPGYEDEDPSIAAEHAFNRGLIYFQIVSDVRWAVLSMAAAALYHLVEQQFCDLCRLSFLGPDGEPLDRNKSIYLLKHLGIDVEALSTWPRIKELRYLANCVKHAEGNSCNQLRKDRPELFQKPTIEPELYMSGSPIRVRNPLMGEDIYVTEREFDSYVDAVREFWRQLVEELKRVGS